MYRNNKLVIGKNGDNELCILPKMANRHGIITGASGSGKTTTVKVMAESFSSAGIPVFYVDVKGDLASICKSGEPNENAFEWYPALEPSFYDPTLTVFHFCF